MRILREVPLITDGADIRPGPSHLPEGRALLEKHQRLPPIIPRRDEPERRNAICRVEPEIRRLASISLFADETNRVVELPAREAHIRLATAVDQNEARI